MLHVDLTDEIAVPARHATGISHTLNLEHVAGAGPGWNSEIVDLIVSVDIYAITAAPHPRIPDRDRSSEFGHTCRGIDRDLNAARNILHAGTALLAGAESCSKYRGALGN